MNSLEIFSYTFTFCGTFKNIVVFLPYMQSYYPVSFSFIRWGRVFYVKSVLQLLALALGKEMGWVKLLETTPNPGLDPTLPGQKPGWASPRTPRWAPPGGAVQGGAPVLPPPSQVPLQKGTRSRVVLKYLTSPPPNNNKIKN